MNDKIHVLIADDHAIVRQGLKQILSETEDLVVAGEADDGAEALQLARQQEWNVFLLDVSMPNRNGIDTLKQLKKEFPKLPVLILSMHPEEQYAVRALKAGASGYVIKKSELDELLLGIQAVHRGNPYFSSSIGDGDLTDYLWQLKSNSGRVGYDLLTAREREVLQLLTQGLANKTIAAQLSISEHTVKFHVNAIMTKLGAQSRTDAVVRATRLGLVIL